MEKRPAASSPCRLSLDRVNHSLPPPGSHQSHQCHHLPSPPSFSNLTGTGLKCPLATFRGAALEVEHIWLPFSPPPLFDFAVSECIPHLSWCSCQSSIFHLDQVKSKVTRFFTFALGLLHLRFYPLNFTRLSQASIRLRPTSNRQDADLRSHCTERSGSASCCYRKYSLLRRRDPYLILNSIGLDQCQILFMPFEYRQPLQLRPTARVRLEWTGRRKGFPKVRWFRLLRLCIRQLFPYQARCFNSPNLPSK